MTDYEIKRIYELKKLGYGYKKIATELDLPISTIKSYLLRHPNDDTDCCCLLCGKKLINIPNKKRKKYCSSKCKEEYYRNNLELLSSSKTETRRCKCCGNTFITYQSNSKKYCSHKCYIKSRYQVIGDCHE